MIDVAVTTTAWRSKTCLLVATLILLAVPACGGAGSASPSPGAVSGGGGDGTPAPGAGGGGGTDALQGGVLATFTVNTAGPEQFRAWVTSPAVAQQLVDVWTGAATMSFLRGALVAGAGEAAHNEPWSWHLDPTSIQVDPFGVGVCAAWPSAAEADAPLFTNVNQCLWAATALIDLEDKR